MQSSPIVPYPAPGSVRRDDHALPDIALRRAQRAFAAAFERPRTHGFSAALHAARQRRLARRSLSALSADERQRLLRWLAWQQVTASVRPILARIDDELAARIDALARPLAARLAGLPPASRIDGLRAAG